eukprot:g1329.t1
MSIANHEGITLANTIRQRNGDIEDNLSFLEVQDMQGMTTDEYATHEIREIHKSLKESFSFKNSPILNDLKQLKEIPHGNVLLPNELKAHREEISMLLEKAMSMKRWGFGKAAAKTATSSKKTSLGECERTTWGTCGKHSECRPDKSNPCRGECMCDTDGLNACKCVAKGTIARLAEKKELAKVDTGTILDAEKNIEKALTVKGVGVSVLFGFVDGFLGGMATDIKEGWKDGACQDRSEIGSRFKYVLRKAKHFWHAIKSIHKKVWTSAGRRHLINAVKALLKALAVALKSVWKFATTCPATKMIGLILGIIVVMVLLNMAFIAAGYVVIPLLIKLVGGLIGLYGSFDYMKDTVIDIYRAVRILMAGKCTTSCKKTLIEKSSAMVGAIVEVILLGGLGDFAKVSKTPAATGLFKRYKIKPSDSFISDMKTLKKSATNAKKGVKTSIKKLGRRVSAVKETGVRKTVVDIAKKQRNVIKAKAKTAVTYAENKAKQLRNYVAQFSLCFDFFVFC